MTWWYLPAAVCALHKTISLQSVTVYDWTQTEGLSLLVIGVQVREPGDVERRVECDC